MVSSSERSPDPTDDAAEPDSRTSPGFDEARLYAVVRRAVTDALLDVVGTLLLVGLGFVLVVVGGQAALLAVSPVGGAVGVALAVVGLGLAAVALDLVPFVRDWL